MFVDPSGKVAVIDDATYAAVGIGLLVIAGVVFATTLSSTGDVEIASSKAVSNFKGNIDYIVENTKKLLGNIDLSSKTANSDVEDDKTYK